MTDCSNVEMRELLPDLVSGTLSRMERARVEQHLTDCADCTQELGILRGVFALRPAAPSVDVASIVAALPRPAVQRRRHAGWQRWRVAAAIGVLAIGGLSWQVARNGGITLSGEAQVGDSIMQVASSIDSGMSHASASAVAGDMPTVREVAVSFGGLGDYTDEELQEILDRLEQWDGVTSAESRASMLPVLTAGTEGDR